jgi:integrase
MPKLAANAVPSYRLHKQSGQAIVTLSGKDFCLGQYNTPESHAKYNRLIAEWLANGRQLGADETDFTICDVLAGFWRHAETYYRKPDGSPTSELKNYRDALGPVRRLYADTPANRFGPLALQAVRDEMIRQGWCRTYINKQIIRVRSVFKWAVGTEMVAPSVYQGLAAVPGLRAGRTTARESAPVKPVPEDVVAATLPFLSRQIAAMAQLQLVTGMRPGEVCAMRRGDIDTNGPIWVYQPTSHKTSHHGHERFVFLGPKAQEILTPFMFRGSQAHLFSPAEAEAERRAARSAMRKTPASCGHRSGANRKRNPRKRPGAFYSAISYAHAVRKACIRANKEREETGQSDAKSGAMLPRWHPHQLRHTAATRLRREFGLEAAQVILGHRTLTVTQVYAEKNIAAARSVVAIAG